MEQRKQEIVYSLINKVKAKQAHEKDNYEYENIEYNSDPAEAYYQSKGINQDDFMNSKHPVNFRANQMAEFLHALPSCVCKHKSFLARMFYQNVGPFWVHIFHIS
jgi:hypothetical protein